MSFLLQSAMLSLYLLFFIHHSTRDPKIEYIGVFVELRDAHHVVVMQIPVGHVVAASACVAATPVLSSKAGGEQAEQEDQINLHGILGGGGGREGR